LIGSAPPGPCSIKDPNVPRRNTNVRLRRPSRRRSTASRGNEPRFPGHHIGPYGPFGAALVLVSLVGTTNAANS
jgi:hypothetical protein